MRRTIFMLCVVCYLLAGFSTSVSAAVLAPSTGKQVTPTPTVITTPIDGVPVSPTANTTTPNTTITHASDSCIFNMNVPIIGPFPIDFCSLMSAAIGTWTVSITQAVNDIGIKDFQYIWSIPPQVTYANGDVHVFWIGTLGLVDGGVILWVLLGILVVIFRGGGYWIHYADIMEVVPKVLLGLFAAHSSLYFIQLFVDITNAFCNAFTFANPAGFSLSQLALGDQGIVNVFIQFFGFVMALFNLLLFIERLLGLAAVVVLTASSPIWMFAFAVGWVVPGIQRFARVCFTGFFVVLGTLAAQIFVISLTTRMLFSSIFAGNSPGETLFRGLIAIAMLAFCLSIPRLFGTWMSASPDLGLLGMSAKAVSKVV